MAELFISDVSVPINSSSFRVSGNITSSGGATIAGIHTSPVPGDTLNIDYANKALEIALKGTLPRTQYDNVYLANSAAVYTYTFSYEGIRQFTIDVTNPSSSFTVEITEINNVLLEDGSGVLLLESGDELLLEG